MPRPQFATRRRLGCIPSLVLYFVLAFVTLEVITAVFAPWAFNLGGHLHAVAMWQGMGRLHSATAGDFALFVRFAPTPGGRTGAAYVRGVAYLCTPRGERFSLRLTGGSSKRVWRDMNGQSFALDMANRPLLWQFKSDYTTWHPRLALKGRWQYPDLVMDDGGTLAREFSPDGRLYAGPEKKRPGPGQKVNITFKEAAESEFESACSSLAR